jgi:hypothetical protein
MSNQLNRAFGSMEGSIRTPKKTALTLSTKIPTGSPMTTHRGGTYNTGISEKAVEQKAIEDGQAGILDTSMVGKNSHPHAVDQLVEGQDAATGVVAYDLRDTVQGAAEQLNRQQEEVNKTEAETVEAIDEHTSATRQMLVQRQKMRAAGLPVPGRKHFLYPVLQLLLLFLGDWGLLALGFQIMGLSDRPWIPLLAFTDDLHLAALSAVVALVFLGHIVGGHVRRIEHALEVRRQSGDDRDDLPKPAVFDYIWAGAAFATAVAGMICLSDIRAEYLNAMGVDANFWAFVGVQFLILAAAIGISFAHANPEAEKWKAIDKALEASTVKRNRTVGSHIAAVGNFNAIIDRRLADIAQAGHHVSTDAANARGQIAAYKRRYILSQMEPAQEQLFADHLKTKDYLDQELLRRLTGITPFPVFSKAITQKVMDALAAALKEVSTLRAQIDQIEINKLDLPDESELFASKRAAVEEEATAADASETEPPEADADVETVEVDATDTPAGSKLHPVPTTTEDNDVVTADDPDDSRESA